MCDFAWLYFLYVSARAHTYTCALWVWGLKGARQNVTTAMRQRKRMRSNASIPLLGPPVEGSMEATGEIGFVRGELSPTPSSSPLDGFRPGQSARRVAQPWIRGGLRMWPMRCGRFSMVPHWWFGLVWGFEPQQGCGIKGFTPMSLWLFGNRSLHFNFLAETGHIFHGTHRKG